MNGWIKLHRKLLDNWVSQDPELLAVWVRILLEANHADIKKMFNGSLIQIDRGQMIFGLNAFSKKSGVSISKLRRFLKLFESEQMISRQKTNKFSLITITCFEDYQAFDSQCAGKAQASDKPATSQRQHRKNVKKEKKYTSGDLSIAEMIYKSVLEVMPKTKEPNIDKWADTIRLMREKDNLTLAEIESVFKWANNDEFWKNNILSPEKLRVQFARLHAKTEHAGNNNDYGMTGAI